MHFSGLLLIFAAVGSCRAASTGDAALGSTVGPVDVTSQVVVTTTESMVWGSKPDCNEDPARQFYPHSDCNKYWWCVDGEARLMLCSPGTYFNPVGIGYCDFPENVDTSHCRVWVCEADGDMFAGAACNEFYECEHGQPTSMICAEGLYFNPVLERCDMPENIDTSTCNVPELMLVNNPRQ